MSLFEEVLVETWSKCVAVQLAISRDGHSGGIVRTAVIKKDGIQRSLITERDFVFSN